MSDESRVADDVPGIVASRYDRVEGEVMGDKGIKYNREVSTKARRVEEDG